MKRILSFITVIVLSAFGVKAQSLSLKYEEEVVDNDTVYITGEPNDDLLEWHLQVKNLTDKDIEVKVKKNEISVVENTVNTFCWGSCFLPSVYLSPAPITIRANSTDYNSFAGDYEPSGMEGTSIISYTFFNVSDEKDSVMITAFYQAGTSGIRDFGTDGFEVLVYPNPAKDYLYLEFENITEQNVSIRIYDLSGRTLKQFQYPGQYESNYRISLNGISYSAVVLEIRTGKEILARKKILVGK